MVASHHTSESSEAGDGLVNRRGALWVRPSVNRLAAGSAEDGNNNKPDNAQPS
jgi:hypothetical protein